MSVKGVHSGFLPLKSHNPGEKPDVVHPKNHNESNSLTIVCRKWTT